MRDFLPADPDLRAQRERTLTQLGHAYALVRRLGEMDATRVNEFVCTLLEDGAAQQIEAVLDHLDVASGAWRELAEQADSVIERVADSLAVAVLGRTTPTDRGAA